MKNSPIEEVSRKFLFLRKDQEEVAEHQSRETAGHSRESSPAFPRGFSVHLERLLSPGWVGCVEVVVGTIAGAGGRERDGMTSRRTNQAERPVLLR